VSGSAEGGALFRGGADAPWGGEEVDGEERLRRNKVRQELLGWKNRRWVGIGEEGVSGVQEVGPLAVLFSSGLISL
jgi:hypothetical protein